MECEDLIIGSGLTALGAALGLSPRRRVVVLAGNPPGHFQYYPDSRDTPCAYLGPGGLGQHWHGVIPTPALTQDEFGGEAFVRLFNQFYPHTDPRPHLDEPRLFVPWKPVRPLREWKRLQALRGTRLQWRVESALDIDINSMDATAAAVAVRTAQNTYRAQRVWIAAGCLHTPALLERALQRQLARQCVSDHAIVYLGQVDRAQTPQVAAPTVRRTRDGMWVPARSTPGGEALCTLRPARFGFAQLDAGIAQRAAFGLPAGSAIRKLAAGASPGLISEVLYTRLGMFPAARRQSVYAQVMVHDAHAFDASAGRLLGARHDAIHAGVAAIRLQCPWPGLIASRELQLFLPGIHLHHSLQREILREAGLGRDQASLQIVDASDRDGLGSAHHSFRLMLAAAQRTRRLTA